MWIKFLNFWKDKENQSINWFNIASWNLVSKIWAAIANTMWWMWHTTINTTTKTPIQLNKIQSHNLKNIYNILWWNTKDTSSKRLDILYPLLSMHIDDIDRYLEKFALDRSIKKGKLWSDKILKQFVNYTQENISNYNTYWWEWSIYLWNK